MADLAASYRDRSGRESDRGAAIQVAVSPTETRGKYDVTLELGIMRNFGSLSADAWAALTPNEARELADDLRRAADQAETHHA